MITVQIDDRGQRWPIKVPALPRPGDWIVGPSKGDADLKVVAVGWEIGSAVDSVPQAFYPVIYVGRRA